MPTDSAWSLLPAQQGVSRSPGRGQCCWALPGHQRGTSACTPPSSRNPEGGISIGTHRSGGEQPGRSIRPRNGQAWNDPQRAGSPSCTGGLGGRCDPNMSPAHPKAQVCCGRRNREDPCFSLTGGGGARCPLILQTPQEGPPSEGGWVLGNKKTRDSTFPQDSKCPHISYKARCSCHSQLSFLK